MVRPHHDRAFVVVVEEWPRSVIVDHDTILSWSLPDVHLRSLSTEWYDHAQIVLSRGEPSFLAIHPDCVLVISIHEWTQLCVPALYEVLKFSGAT